MDDFLKEIQQDFLEEAKDLLDSFQEECLQLMGDTDGNHLDNIFRVLHNLKGTSQSVELGLFSNKTHIIEDFVENLRRGDVEVVTSADVNHLLEGYDLLMGAVEKMMRGETQESAFGETVIENTPVKVEESPVIEKDTSAVIEEEPIIEEKEVISAPVSEQADVLEETDSGHLVISGPEEVVTSKEEILAPPKENTPPPAMMNDKNQTIRCSVGKVEEMLDVLGETLTLINTLSDKEVNKRPIEKYLNQLHDTCLSLKAVPFKQVSSKVVRAINGAMEKTGKPINLTIEGEHTEINKFVLESLVDPLMHILRNCVDHGIEDKAKRSELGKSEAGEVRVSVNKKSDVFEIEIRDDGGGIDPDKLHAIALEKGLVDQNEELSEEEKINLILKPGFSTKETITDLSGRGVGMDVVAKAIEGLRGTIKIKSELGKGSVFLIHIPVTQSIYFGLMAKVRNQRLIFRTSEIVKIVRVTKRELTAVDKGRFHFKTEGRVANVVQLENVLFESDTKDDDQELNLILTELDNRLYGILVDEIDSRQKLVEKKVEFKHRVLNSYITTDCFSGVSLLPDSSIGAIVNLKGLYQRYIKNDHVA